MSDNQASGNPYYNQVPPKDVTPQVEPAPFAPYAFPENQAPQSPYGPPQIAPMPYGNPPQQGYEQQVYNQQQAYAPQQGYQPQYNEQQPHPYYMQIPPQAPTNKLALIGFILSLAAFVIGLLGSLPAIVLGHIALNQMKTNPTANRWQAITALCLGYAGVAFYVLFLALIFSVQS